MGFTRRDLMLAAGSAAVGGLIGGFTASGKGWRTNSAVPRALAVATEETLPTEVDVIVIGGGIVGLSTALFLNERGMNTIVLEKGVVAGEQSSRAFGWVYSNGWSVDKLQMVNRSKEIWQGFSKRFGEDIGYRQTGNFNLLRSDEEIETSREWLKAALERHPEMDAEIVMGSRLDALIPGASSKYKAALYQSSDGMAEPTFSVSMIAQGAMREGVRIFAPCAARTLEREGGKVAGVYTEHGYVKAKSVVLAGGVWSSLFAGNAGIRIPQLAVSSQLQRLSKVDGPLRGAGFGGTFAFRKMYNGELQLGSFFNVSPITTDSFRYMKEFFPALKHSSDLVKVRLSQDFFESLKMKTSWGAEEITPFEDIRMLSGTVAHEEADIELEAFRKAFPQYRSAVVKERWAGMIDGTPDATAYVSAVPEIPGLFVGAGYYNGFSAGPATGELLAQMVAGEKPKVDPHMYRLNRFTDGSEFIFRH